MDQSTLVIVAPAVEPLSLAEAKLHCRVTHSAEDALITSMIKAARQRLEIETRRTYCTQTLRLVRSRFPGCGDPWADRIHLPVPPTQSITSIQYVDNDGETQTWASDQWRLITNDPSYIERAYGVSWPSTRPQSDAVTITFVAGYGDAAAVPELAKDAMRLMIGHRYANREEVVIGTIAGELPAGVKSIIRDLRWGDYR